MPAIEKRSTIAVPAPTIKPNVWSNDRRCQNISSSDRRRPTRSCGSSPLTTCPKPVCRQTNAGWRANRQTHRARCPRHRVEHRGLIVAHREILDDANDFMPSTFALRATADKPAFALRGGFSVAVTNAAAERVRRSPSDFRDERPIDDHRRTPRPEVARIKTAPGEKAHAEDLEVLVVYRVELCLDLLAPHAPPPRYQQTVLRAAWPLTPSRRRCRPRTSAVSPLRF